MNISRSGSTLKIPSAYNSRTKPAIDSQLTVWPNMSKEPKPFVGCFTLVRQTRQRDLYVPLNCNVLDSFLQPKELLVARIPQPVTSGAQEIPDAAISLRDHQTDAFAIIMSSLETKGSAVASLRVGFGKTILALCAVGALKAKTLILVHKLALLEQWRTACEKVLPTCNVGILQGTHSPTEKNTVVIGMIQTVLSRMKQDPDLLSHYDFLILDEVHHCCAKTFSKVLLYHRARYVLALSATLDRPDGLGFVLNLFLGEACINNTELVIKPVIHILKLPDYSVEMHTVYSKKEKRDIINFAKLVTDIASNKTRHMDIASVIAHLCIPKRKILVLSKRRDECKQLQLVLDKTFSCDTTLLLGGAANPNLDAQVILATTGSAGEGFDCPSLNCLVLLSSQKDVKQEIGRILRKAPAEGELAPMVIDIIDSHGVFQRHKASRCEYYKRQNLHISTFTLETIKTL